ncbi:MAG: hypothetical protein MUE42_05790 [Opitutaceae bacterium]|jgi:hypothetical protein|nr:hypothetical protein [Opitutaceae bacterium]
MGTLQTLKLDSNDIGQIIDGLRWRADSWRETADYLESGHASRNDFAAEECSDAEEARSIASHYERIIREVATQLHPPVGRRLKRKQPKSKPDCGYCIFINTLFQGTTISVHDGNDLPVIFSSEREAQLEIVDFHMTRIQEFIDGERDYDDALEIEEYVMPVTVLPDGVVVDECGRQYRKKS